MSIVVVYLASPREWGHLKWTRLDCLCASVTLLKKYAQPLPVVIFHEDYNDEDKKRLWGIIPDIRFELVDFSTHKEHYVSQRPNERVGSYGYYMMCRFLSGVMQAHPAVSGYSHYIRLDDDSYIVRQIEPDVFKRILEHDYTYSSTFHDPHPTLWDYTLRFMQSENLPARYSPPSEVPYNNFHAARLDLWRHPVVGRFIAGIERQHGCLKLGWDDAVIQSMIANVICPAVGLSVNLESGFHYRHNQQCIHTGGHTKHCSDGTGSQYYWGPPDQLD